MFVKCREIAYLRAFLHESPFRRFSETENAVGFLFEKVRVGCGWLRLYGCGLLVICYGFYKIKKHLLNLLNLRVVKTCFIHCVAHILVKSSAERWENTEKLPQMGVK